MGQSIDTDRASALVNLKVGSTETKCLCVCNINAVIVWNGSMRKVTRLTDSIEQVKKE